MVDPAIEPLARSLSDRYRIERELGRGGMATVYLARDLKHERNVAIKVMQPEIATQIGRGRFLREIEVTARLAHPHVLPLYDSGAVGDNLFYVMPYVSGGSLRARLVAESVLGLDETLRLTREIASALGRAHEEGLVHRDVKPENVLLADGIAQVADFGIAREDPLANASPQHATRTQTSLGITLGTPRYMPPEQSAGEALDGRADQYALACVVYEMLAGQPPFTAPSAMALAARHANDPVPSLASLHPGLPRGVESVIARALSKHAADRYPTMAAFAEALVVAAATPGTSAHMDPAAPVRDQLPRPRTRFVGRERERAACLAALDAGRLLTITGIGGSGKTRLAIELASDLRGRFRDGIWYADLAPLKEAERLSLSLAAALSLKDDGTTPPLDAIVARMRDRDALIVLDNCEHVIAAASEVVDALLGAGDRLRVIVTSREGLGIEGERTFTLHSLAMPAAGAAGAELERSEAVQLFLDRARSVIPDFVLDGETAPAVTEICRRLDGIPLALELAAARLRVLRAGEIAARLDDRFRLLTGGSRTALPRHQTLQAAVQWSYDLLDDEERRVLRHASVFAGGWTLAGMSRVMGKGADEFELIERMDRLVDKSLVVVQREVTGGSRYAMLETVRQFAMDRLGEAGESVAARERHLDHFTAVAERAAAERSGPQEATWIARLPAERENLLAAHEWADRDPAYAERGLRLAGALHHYWSAVASPRVGRRTLAEALARPGAAAPTPARALALYAAGSMAYFGQDVEATRRYAEECLAISRTLGDDDLRIDALMVCGMATFARGDQPATLEYLREQVELARSRGDDVRLARALNALGDVVRFHGDLAASEPMYLEARLIAERRNDAGSLLIQIGNLTLVALGRGDETGARRLLRETLASIGTGARSRPIVMDNAAGLAALREEWARAARWRGAAAAEHERKETARELEDETTLEPIVDRARKVLGTESFDRIYTEGSLLDLRQALAEIEAWLATLEAS